MLESSRNDFIAAGSLGRRGRFGLVLLVCASAASAIGLGGCATAAPAHTAGLDDAFGAAVAHNMQAQHVAPTAAQKDNTFIPPNPERQRRAVETYEAGEVELATAETGRESD